MPSSLNKPNSGLLEILQNDFINLTLLLLRFIHLKYYCLGVITSAVIHTITVTIVIVFIRFILFLTIAITVVITVAVNIMIFGHFCIGEPRNGLTVSWLKTGAGCPVTLCTC